MKEIFLILVGLACGFLAAFALGIVNELPAICEYLGYQVQA